MKQDGWNTGGLWNRITDLRVGEHGLTQRE